MHVAEKGSRTKIRPITKIFGRKTSPAAARRKAVINYSREEDRTGGGRRDWSTRPRAVTRGKCM